jgi:hypothetical protein
MDQAAQVFGSLLILAAFVAAQLGATSTKSRIYLMLNLAGSIVLTIIAAMQLQLGFLLLEGCWAVVSAWELVRRCRSLPSKTPPESLRSQRG